MSSNKLIRKKKAGGILGVAKRIKSPGTVDVGLIDAGMHYSGDITVAGIGFVHEFGTETIPERSFIRSTLKEQRNNIITLQKKLLSKISSGDMDTVKALGLIGEFVADKIRRKIVALKTPPNDPETIEAKGSSNPLIDTSQMKNLITFEVNR